MSRIATVAIHASQFPDRVRQDLIEGLLTRRLNHKFLYDSLKQTQKWLRLHQAYSPSRTDADCAATYDRAFAAAAAGLPATKVHLAGLGCGGGQKDARLLRLLSGAGKEASYTPADASLTLVLIARQKALEVISQEQCFPLVCDLGSAADLAAALDRHGPATATRLFTFFGMLPNFEPQQILPRLASLVRPGDFLLLSANLAPGSDYESGVRHVLPLYDNPLTRDWLMAFLLDLGCESGDGELRFMIEEDSGTDGLKRIAAWFRFLRAREIEVDDTRLAFGVGEELRLFFSYRHTPARVRALLIARGLSVRDQWISRSEEEGVFLATRL